MIYLIGGAARCGKSTLARRLHAKLPAAQLLSGDSMRQAIKPHLPGQVNFDAIDPALYEYYSRHTAQAVEELQAQGESVWAYIARYIEALQLENDNDIIVDGIDIWPSSVATAPFEYRSIFMVDSSPDQWQRVTNHQSKKHDWMLNRGLTVEQIKAWAIFSAARSRHLTRLCQQYDLPYLDISKLGYGTAQDKAEAILLN